MYRYFITFLVLALIACKGEGNKNEAPETISAGKTADKFVFTEDIDHFWEAFDSIVVANSYEDKLRLINALYIDRGTEGLHAFMGMRAYTDTLYVQLIEDLPLFWSSIRPNTLTVKSRGEEINASIEALKELYPELRPAKIYFTIGGMRSGGTVKDDLSLIGCEIALADKDTDVSEFEEKGHAWLIPFFQSQTSEKLVEMNVHEYVHTQQKNEGTNVVSHALHEGSCDFIAELIIGKPLTSHYMSYGNENEDALKIDFYEEALTEEFEQWFYSADSRYGVQDLGYFMGYAISKSYYDNAPDKKEAVKAIMELDHADSIQIVEFVNASSYFEKDLALDQ